VVTAILKALELKGIFAWRANSGTQVLAATSKARRRVIKGAPAGTPDILLVLPVQARVLSLGAGGMNLESSVWGALCGLEVKSETGSQRLSQKAWQAKAAKHGVRYALVRSIREALAAVEAWASNSPPLAAPPELDKRQVPFPFAKGESAQ
jgi:hypothetical protein